MIVKTIPSSWLIEEEHRLDCGPFVKGSIEAKKVIDGMRCKKDRLVDLTKGGLAGMYHVGQDKIVWVDDFEHGMPFLRSSDILKADLSDQPFISRKQVRNNYLFQCPAGTTLITRSGSIGRMVFARKEMEDMAISQDVLKVVPDEKKVLSGYLYAFLSSKYGVPIVTGGTFGSIIVHIEAGNIANLPVPRLGDVEEQAHALVQQAADLRSDGARLVNDTTNQLAAELDLPELPKNCFSRFGVSTVSSGYLRSRLDATFHSTFALQVEQSIRQGKYQSEKLSEITRRLFKPPMFKRLRVDDENFGKQFVSGIDVYQYESENLRYVSVKTPNFDEFIVKKGWVIFQAAGQIYGLFGKPLFVYGWLENLFCADDLYRIVPKTEVDGAYMFLFFRTPHGEVLIKRQASGNSIPRVWDPQMFTIEIPWPPEDVRKRFSEPVIQAHKKIETARKIENEARILVENAIEAGGRSWRR